MKRIYATLPVLGRCPVQFHRESKDLLEFLGHRELERLNDIPHLGVASFAFTGLNHTRLEYTLLQCAVIGLLPKFNLDTENLAIAAQVRLAGIDTRVSSGEELLKCWSLLSNTGHMQYTYGVERSLMIKAQTDQCLTELLIPRNLPTDIRRWCSHVIEEFDYEHFRYILILRRICSRLPKGSRLKGRLIHMIRNLVLPVEDLFPTAPTQRYKMYRLRSVFQHVRLLSMVTIDAYYSHHPIRYQLGSAVMDLENLLSEPGYDSEFLTLLRRTAGFLADELYFHPEAVAAQRAYESASLRKMRGKLATRLGTADGLSSVLRDARNNGFGKPQAGRLSHLFRISFEPFQQQLLGHRNEYVRSVSIEDALTNGRTTFAAVNHNSMSNTTHVDVFYSKEATVNDIGAICRNTYMWLTRALSAEVLRRARMISTSQDSKQRLAMSERLVRRRVRAEALMRQILDGVTRYLLPEEYTTSITDYIPSEQQSLGVHAYPVRFRLSDTVQVDDITRSISTKLAKNARSLEPARLQELRALEHVYRMSTAPFVIACTETYIVRDANRKPVDEWDGLLLEVSKERVRLIIVEAKKRRMGAQNEAEAFKQLAKTRSLIRKRHQPPTRRVRIPALGASLGVTLV